LPATAVTSKYQMFFLQSLQGLFIGCVPLTLEQYGAVPMQTQGFKGMQNCGDGLTAFSGGIKILHAHGPLPLTGTGIEKTGEGGNYGAGMQGAGGRGRKAPPVRKVWVRIRGYQAAFL